MGGIWELFGLVVDTKLGLKCSLPFFSKLFIELVDIFFWKLNHLSKLVVNPAWGLGVWTLWCWPETRGPHAPSPWPELPSTWWTPGRCCLPWSSPWELVYQGVLVLLSYPFSLATTHCLANKCLRCPVSPGPPDPLPSIIGSLFRQGTPYYSLVRKLCPLPHHAAGGVLLL